MVLSLVLPSSARTISTPTIHGRNSQLVITSLVFFNAEFSSPFLIVETFAFLLSFYSHTSSAQLP